MPIISVRNFSLLGVQSTTITATSTTQNIALSQVNPTDVMLVNDTTTTIFARTGNSSVVADANAMPVLPGEKGVYSKGSTAGTTTHLAVFVVSGTADIIVIQGMGS